MFLDKIRLVSSYVHAVPDSILFPTVGERIKETIGKSREKWWKSRARSVNVYTSAIRRSSLSLSRFFRFHTPATSIYRKRAREKPPSSTRSGAGKNCSKSVKKRLEEVFHRRATGERVEEGLKNG